MLPFHPTVSHLPVVVSFLLPVLILVFALMIRSNKMSASSWLIILGLQVFTTASGYIALESGEVEEHKVEKVVEKKLISEHEEAAEIFVGSTVIALVLSIAAFFIKKEFQFQLQLTVALASVMSCYFGFKAGQLGGDLVYKHGAASAHTKLAEPDASIDDENEYAPEEDDIKDED